MKSGDINQFQKYIISRASDGDNDYSIIYGYASQSLEFYSGRYSGTNPRTNSAIVINDTNWHYITYSYSPGEWSGYLDGVRVFNNSATFTLTMTSGAFFGFSTFDRNSRFFNGRLDDIKIRNRCLVADEVITEYQLGRGGAYKIKPVRYLTTTPARIPNSRSSLITRPPAEPSYESGYAPRDGEPLYPNLFKGLIGAWVPSLGVTGGTLRDVSGRNNHGTLTNMDPASDWVIDGGQYALNFDGINNEIVCSNNTAMDQLTAGTVSVWYRPATTSGMRAILNQWNVNSQQAGIYLFQDNAALGWQVGWFVDRRITASNVFAASQWVHLVATFSVSAMQIIVNGQLRTTGAAPSAGAANSRGVPMRIGYGDGGVGFANGLIDDAIVWSRSLSLNEALQLYQLGRGGMFRVKPQTARKTISLPATWLKVGDEWTEAQPKIATGSKASLITRPPIEPSYENGFAPRDGEPLYPNLFKGLVGAWCPSMGVTGNTLRDLSGRNNHGTLTNMDPATDWVIDNGQYALDFDGSNDYISFSNSEVGKFYQDNFTVSVWVCSTDSSGYEVIIGRDNLNNRSWVIGYGGSGANFQFFDFVSTKHCFSTVDPISNKWYLVTVTRQSFDISIYIDGSLNSSTVQSQVTNYNQNAETRFGSRGYTGFEQWFNGQISEVLLYSRALSPNEIKQLYQLGRGGLFTLKPKTIALPTSTIWQPSQSRLYTGEWK